MSALRPAAPRRDATTRGATARRRSTALRRALASLGVLAASVGALELTPAPASAATVTAGYANVPGTLGQVGWTTLPTSAGYSTSGGAISVYHAATGKYEMLFSGLAPGYALGESVPGVAIAHAGDWGNCQRSSLAVGDGAGNVRINITCYDFDGTIADRPFTTTYTSGGNEEGALATVRLNQQESASTLNVAVTPATQFSSVPGNVTSTRTGTGIYDIRIPRQAGDRPHALDLGAANFTQSATCVISGTSTEAAGTVEKIRVICRGVPGVGAVNTQLDLSFAEEANPLGLKNKMSHAYVTEPGFTKVPVNTPPVTQTSDRARNLIYGVSGFVTLQHTDTGKFEVRMQNQHWQVGAATVSVIPVGAADARCAVNSDFTPSGADFRTVRFQCTNAYGDAFSDNTFQFNYSALQ